MDGVTLHSEVDTARLARILASTLRFGEVVGLQGELGAGKTTLVRSLVGEWRGPESHVASPSFALQHEYPVHLDLDSSRKKIEHWDLYRLQEAPEDLFEPPDVSTLRLIEWPERSAVVMQQLQVLINIAVGDEGQRMVRFSGARGQEITDLVQREFRVIAESSG